MKTRDNPLAPYLFVVGLLICGGLFLVHPALGIPAFALMIFTRQGSPMNFDGLWGWMMTFALIVGGIAALTALLR